MSITGIIVEYNPLHNGHLHHLKMTKAITDSSHIIAVMSGNFLQRGEPAFVNKWARTKMALKAGVDLVLELPVLYSSSSAEGFAFGAVSTLNSLGIVDNICFGSETDNIFMLSEIAQILLEEPVNYKTLLQNNLKLGLSFPSARQNALTNYIINNNLLNVNSKEIKNIIFNSNNILAVEYLKALLKLSSNIIPFSIKRIANSYNETELTGNISSATSIRKNFSCSDHIMGAVPEYTFEIIYDELKAGRGPLSLEDFSDLILYKLRSLSISSIKNLLYVDEGLEYKIKKSAENSGNINELIISIKNKRYTKTRIQRILINALLDKTKDIQYKISYPVEYIRVLGFNNSGRELLNKIKNSACVPVITNPDKKDSDLLKYDIAATDIYVLGYKNHLYKYSKQDLKKHPIIE